MDEIRQKAPYVFTKSATNPKVSNQYVFASTETIINDLDKLGWKVVDCKQQKATKRSTGIRSFHMVAFQNPDIFITKEMNGKEEIECFPRIILTNSHDGFNSFKFMVGLFRLVCSNGLVIATQEFANISIRHINYTFEELRGVVAKAIETVVAQTETMNKMQGIELSDENKRKLATEAYQIRVGENYQPSDEQIEDILTPKREEDKGNSLWNVFNVLQEKIINGDYLMISKTNGKERKARPIKGVAKDLDVNQNLFRTALAYAQAA
jgi:hypothetical protein